MIPEYGTRLRPPLGEIISSPTRHRFRLMQHLGWLGFSADCLKAAADFY
jgi:hypothetical protein